MIKEKLSYLIKLVGTKIKKKKVKKGEFKVRCISVPMMYK
jgi:hypothetical protein